MSDYDNAIKESLMCQFNCTEENLPSVAVQAYVTRIPVDGSRSYFFGCEYEGFSVVDYLMHTFDCLEEDLPTLQDYESRLQSLPSSQRR